METLVPILVSILIVYGIVFFIRAIINEIRITLKTRNQSIQEQVTETKNEEQQEYLPYRKKQYLMSRTEHDFFNKLQNIVGDKYYIFPQVHFSKIVYAEGQQNYRNPYFNKIDRKSADFVLFDKESVTPVLVIEVDDVSHRRFDRVERDEFINKILRRCGIAIIHINPFASHDEVKKNLDAILNPA